MGNTPAGPIGSVVASCDQEVKGQGVLIAAALQQTMIASPSSQVSQIRGTFYSKNIH